MENVCHRWKNERARFGNGNRNWAECREFFSFRERLYISHPSFPVCLPSEVVTADACWCTRTEKQIIKARTRTETGSLRKNAAFAVVCRGRDGERRALTVSAEGFGERWGVGDVVGGVLLGDQCDYWPIRYLDNRGRGSVSIIPNTNLKNQNTILGECWIKTFKTQFCP